MKYKLSTRGYFVLAAIIIILIIGGFWVVERLSYNAVDTVEPENNFLTYLDRGLDEETQLFHDNKIAELEASIASQGEEPSLGDLLELGNAYNTIGELGKAKETYGQILLRNPNDAPALENLGSTLYLMEDYYGAEEAWVAAAEISGSEPHILRLVSLIHNHIPEHESKIQEILQLAIGHLGQTPGLLTALGEWYLNQGDYSRAVSHYEVALDVEPENEQIELRLEEIREEWRNAE